jgi:asparagine synthase (glutamine-hydrolysing)
VPGIFGSWQYRPSREALGRLIRAQASSMMHRNSYLVNYRVLDEHCAAGVVQLGVGNGKEQPVTSRDDRYVIFMDGEFHNHNELRGRYLTDTRGDGTLERLNDVSLALQLYLSAGWKWLEVADGLFNLLLYDLRERELCIITDRFGVRPLYMHFGSEGITFGSEVKAVLANSGIAKKIDKAAVKEFFTFGYFPEGRTWIYGIRAVTPASVMTIGLEGTSEYTYWSWSEIGLLPLSVRFEEAMHELGQLWLDAVGRRVDDIRPVVVGLSGGLDSRAILAAIPDDIDEVHTVTFGIPGCRDVRFAVKASEMKGAIHHVIEISSANWLTSPFEMVWQTDGLVNLFYNRGAVADNLLYQLGGVGMIGFLASETVAGGYWPGWERKTREKRDVDQCIRLMYHGFPLGLDRREAIAEIEIMWKKSSLSLHPFLVNQVIKKFSPVASCRRFNIEIRKPFLDRRFVEFAMGLPEAWLSGSKIYKAMLLKWFPTYYQKIPEPKTGLPITAGGLQVLAVSYGQRIINKISRKVSSITGHPFRDRRNFVDHDRWVLALPARRVIKHLLLGAEARWSDYLPNDRGLSVVRRHVAGSHIETETILGLLTFEIYLKHLDGDKQVPER